MQLEGALAHVLGSSSLSRRPALTSRGGYHGALSDVRRLAALVRIRLELVELCVEAASPQV
jgi:hypothetical protein